MEFKVELPDWVNPKLTLMLLAGQELVAFKHPSGDIKIKKTRCNNCGECCLFIMDGSTPFGNDDEGKCNALEKRDGSWHCTAGPNKPFRCLFDPPGHDGCSIEYY